MPDHRQHRGPHPEDQHLFAAANLPRLQTATQELSWLLTRGYASPSAVKLVGDRHQLNSRQRVHSGWFRGKTLRRSVSGLRVRPIRQRHGTRG